jgi:carbonic anhydrase/acetyltransferase-like protein (isoleucine patch superfamily)
VTEGKSFADLSLVVGSPARVVRPVGDAAMEVLRTSARVYCERARQYAAGLKEIQV